MDFIYEIFQHFLSDIKVGDDAVFERADSSNIGGCATKHAFGIVAYRDDTVAVPFFPIGYDRRLVENNAVASSVDKRIGCTKINGKIP